MTGRRKWGAALCAAVLCACLSGAGLSQRPPVLAEETAPVVYDFAEQTELEDFSAFYVGTEAGTDGTLENFSDRWTFGNSTVTSVRAGTGTGSTGKVNVLTLNRYRFDNFEARLLMNYVGDSSWGWGGLSFRQQDFGSGWRADGCLAFVQREGFVNLWGSPDFDDTNSEGQKPAGFSKTSPFLLTVRAVGAEATATLSDPEGSTVYSTVRHTFEKPEALGAGFLSLVSIDNAHAFDRLEVRALDAAGAPALPEEQVRPASVTLTGPSALPAETGARLSASVLPAGADDRLIWTTSDASVAVVRGGSVTGLRPGTATVTVISPYSREVTASLELRVTQRPAAALDLSFSDPAVMEFLTASFVESASSATGRTAWSDRWSLTAEGTLRRRALGSADPDGDVASLFVRDRSFQNFQATAVYRNGNGEFGWFGFSSGNDRDDKRFLDNGQGFFVQREGYPTVWGDTVGGPFEGKAAGYDTRDWHILRVRVFGNTAELYVDDLTEPALVKRDADFSAGRLGLFASGRAEFEVRGLSVDYLDASGKVVDFGGIESLRFKQKLSSAKVGESFVPEAEILPGAAEGFEWQLSTSNGNICFVRGNKLYFIGTGEVTITLTTPFDPSLSDSMTVTVTADEQEKQYRYVSAEKEPPAGCGGCGKSDAAAAGAALAVGALLLAVTKR